MHVARNLRWLKSAAATSCIFTMSAVGGAHAESDDFPWRGPPIDYGGYTWIVDRHKTDIFEGIGPFMGRDDVLQIRIGKDGWMGNRFVGEFPDGDIPNKYHDMNRTQYNTQGRHVQADLPVGPSFVTADLYIPKEWQAARTGQVSSGSNGDDVRGDAVETGLWALVQLPDRSRDLGYTWYDFPLIEFTNANEDGFFQIWDGGSNKPVDASANYGDWNTLRIEVHQDRYDFFVNGELVYSDTEITEEDESFLARFSLNSYNYGNAADPEQSTEYDAYYSNVLAGLIRSVPESGVATVSAPADGFRYQTQITGTFASRRGVQPFATFEPQNDSWVRVGGFGGDITSVPGLTTQVHGTFIQGGIDLLEPVPGLSIGVMGQYGWIDGDDTAGSGSNASVSGIGVYASYAADRYYFDSTAVFGWEDWSFATPTDGSGETGGRTFTASVETGAAFDLSSSSRIIPYGQMLYHTADVDDVTIGMFSTRYDFDGQLSGRLGARFEQQMPTADLAGRLYLDASISHLLTGATDVVVTSPAFQGGNAVTIEGASDDLTGSVLAGFDVYLAPTIRMFGEGGASFAESGHLWQAQAGFALKF